MPLMAQTREFEAHRYISTSGDTLLYRKLTPQKIEEGVKYPILLFLHGAGERGNDNILQLTHGAMMFTNPVNSEKYPCFVVFPQCPSDKYWPLSTPPTGFFNGNPFPPDDEISTPLKLTKELLDKLVKEQPIDKNRIYVVGLSMGGMGVFDITCRYPNYFAAAVPICGGINISRFDGFKSKTSFRIVHGDADRVVPVSFSREAYLTLKEEEVDVEYIEFPGVNHNSWDPAFNLPNFMEWIFSKQLP